MPRKRKTTVQIINKVRHAEVLLFYGRSVREVTKEPAILGHSSETSYPPGHFILKLKRQSGGKHASRGKRKVRSEIQVHGAADRCKRGNRKELW